MSSTATLTVLVFLLSLSLFVSSSSAGRRLTATTHSPLSSSSSSSDGYDPMLFQYHKGPLLAGNFSVNLIWYGKFTPAQRAIVSDFIASLATSHLRPSVSIWWSSLSKYYHLSHRSGAAASLSLTLGHQTLDDSYSVGKHLASDQLHSLASSQSNRNSITVLLTSSDVTVDRFCMSRCATHGSSSDRSTFIWVGNSETQCPGMCAWPFHQPIYGPQSPPLVAPNNDAGMDGMVINLAAMLAGTATNPYGNGYFQGPKEAPLEASSACPGVYGRGAYPGYAGDLLVDAASGASYNAHGVNGRRYLLPGLYDPATSTCSTLV